jgi:hypothetical protein
MYYSAQLSIGASERKLLPLANPLNSAARMVHNENDLHMENRGGVEKHIGAVRKTAQLK